MISSIYRYFTHGGLAINSRGSQNEKMNLGFDDNPVNEMNSAGSEFTSHVINAQGIVRLLDGLCSRKFKNNDYEHNRLLVIKYIQPFIDGIYDCHNSGGYTRGDVFALLALRGAIPDFKKLITPPHNQVCANNKGLLVKFEQILWGADSRYIKEWNDQNIQIVTSNLGFGQRYNLVEIRAICAEVRKHLSRYLNHSVKPKQVSSVSHQPHVVTPVKPKQLQRHAKQMNLLTIPEERSVF